MLDDAVILFTKIFYNNILNQLEICDAFKKAKASVEFKYQYSEADLFTLLLSNDAGPCTAQEH